MARYTAKGLSSRPGWGIEPSAVVGHSVGEVAAVHLAGILDEPAVGPRSPLLALFEKLVSGTVAGTDACSRSEQRLYDSYFSNDAKAFSASATQASPLTVRKPG